MPFGISPPPAGWGLEPGASHSTGSLVKSLSQSSDAAMMDSRPAATIAFSATVCFVTACMLRTGPFMIDMVAEPMTPTRATAPNKAKKTFPEILLRFLYVMAFDCP